MNDLMFSCSQTWQWRHERARLVCGRWGLPVPVWVQPRYPDTAMLPGRFCSQYLGLDTPYATSISSHAAETTQRRQRCRWLCVGNTGLVGLIQMSGRGRWRRAPTTKIRARILSAAPTDPIYWGIWSWRLGFWKNIDRLFNQTFII